MAEFPSFNDRDWNLWFKMAVNWYERGVFLGISGLNAPERDDTTYDLQKKICYYTASIAAI